MRTIAALAALAFASAAFPAPPPAPALSVGVTDIRQLEFNWDAVPGAQSYELWFRALPGAEWVKYRDQSARRAPLFRVGVSVHLLDWRQARYYVKACNWGGCNASNMVGVDGLQLEAIGYFKPATPGAGQYFGFNFAVSADGTTMAVVASERIDRVSSRAAIHVYRKTTPTSRWRLEARLFPNPHEPGSTSIAGDPIAISGDGATIAFGNWIEYQYTGAVYLFRRDADGWRQTQRITGRGGGTDQFGINVKLAAAGRTLVIGRNQPGLVRREGTLEVYHDPDDSSDQFVHATTVEAPEFEDPQWGWCRSVAMSEVGHIVRSCFDGVMPRLYTQVLTATSWAPLQYAETARISGGSGLEVAIDFAGRYLLVHDGPTPSATIYRRDAGGWVADATFAPFPAGVNHVAISGDGKIMAIGSSHDTLAGRGPLFAPIRGSQPTGTVAIYERRSSGWRLRRFVKADSEHTLNSFGYEVALNENGHVLAVGSPYDASRATGIDGDREDASMQGRGAVWLY